MAAPVEKPTRWSDSYEKEAVARSLYVDHEMRTRGDGAWRPWHQLDRSVQDRWLHQADVCMRAINEYRYSKELDAPLERRLTQNPDSGNRPGLDNV